MSYAAKHICTYEEMINKRKREIVSVVSGAPHPVGCATGGTVRYFPPNSAAIHWRTPTRNFRLSLTRIIRSLCSGFVSHQRDGSAETQQH